MRAAKRKKELRSLSYDALEGLGVARRAFPAFQQQLDLSSQQHKKQANSHHSRTLRALKPLEIRPSLGSKSRNPKIYGSSHLQKPAVPIVVRGNVLAIRRSHGALAGPGAFSRFAGVTSWRCYNL